MSAATAPPRPASFADSLRPATHLFHRNWLVYKRIWYRSLFFGFLQPFMFLAAMGLGVGALLARSNPNAFGSVGYIGFLGPGLLGSTVMQTASFESTYPIMNKIMWGRNYEAILASPLSTRNVVIGERSRRRRPTTSASRGSTAS